MKGNPYKMAYLDGNRISEHRALAYKIYNGIPAGYIIHHKDNNPTNNELSNLVMVTKAEHYLLTIREDKKHCIISHKKRIAEAENELDVMEIRHREFFDLIDKSSLENDW